jgi:hypothetical protein
MARAAHLVDLNRRTKEAALAKKERDLARRRGAAIRELYWSDEEIAAEEQLLRAEIDRRIAAGYVTICPPFGLKGDRADLKAAADVAHVMKNWVITDDGGAGTGEIP